MIVWTTVDKAISHLLDKKFARATLVNYASNPTHLCYVLSQAMRLLRPVMFSNCATELRADLKIANRLSPALSPPPPQQQDL